MSISQVQKRRILEEITRIYYASGERPLPMDILGDASKYFSKYPLGLPVGVPEEYIVSDATSNVEKFNELMQNYAFDLEVLYEVCGDQVQDLMDLTTMLRTHLERLRARREKLIARVDDYLFTLYNTDGYYYSVSDTFTTLDLIDLNLTSTFIDTVSGTVSIPSISSLTKAVPISRIKGINVQLTANGANTAGITKSPVTSALDGLTNTAWHVEIESVQPTQEMVATLTLNLGTTEHPVKMSRVDFDPFGIQPVQVFMEIAPRLENGTVGTIKDFGTQIKTSAYNMTFVDQMVTADRLIVTMRKTEPDYTKDVNGVTKHVYIFGAKNITISEQVYDSQGVLITQPLFIEEDLVDDNVIDAVSLVAELDTPSGTDIQFYAATDNPNATRVDDFEWHAIEPLEAENLAQNSIVRFNGAESYTKYIRAEPATGELKLIPFDSTNSDLNKRNPSPSIFPGLDVYRVAEFSDTGFLTASLTLEEGVNTTRIMHLPLSASAIEGLDFWRDYITGVKAASTTYGRIDIGNEFFYGGDVGEAGRSVYIETMLETKDELPLILKKISKADTNSQRWDVKLYLNGVAVADLPVGTDNQTVPFKFQKGLNHIAIIANIPASTDSVPNPYLGSIDLMGDQDLHNFGTVKLATWQYVDPFKMQYNEVNSPYTFTIVNGEIISRRKPTTNFRLRYSKPTDNAPSGVRLRADLTRKSNVSQISPLLKSYRLRFLYS